jgi:hypothetical protein
MDAEKRKAELLKKDAELKMKKVEDDKKALILLKKK